MNTAAAKFQQEVDQSVRAGNGVIFCRSDDPNRAIQLLEMVITSFDNSNKGGALWTVINGVTDLRTESKLVSADKASNEKTPKNPILSSKKTEEGLNTISDTLKAMGDIKNPILKGYNHLIAMWANHSIDESKAMIQWLFNLHTELTMVADENDNIGRRLYIVVPEHWDAPKELSNIPMVNLELPVAEELAEMAADFLIADDMAISETDLEPFDFNKNEMLSIGDAGAGMRCNAFMDAVARVSNMRPKYEGNQMSAEDFVLEVRDIKIREVNKHIALRFETNLVNEEDVAGLDNIKLMAKVMRNAMTIDAQKRGCKLPKGSLLAGSPGVGKTYIASMKASIMGIPMIHFNFNAIHDKYVGESGKRLRAALELIKSQGNVLVLVDEVEKAISKDSNGSNGGTGKALLGELLTFLSDNNSGCYFLLTANNVANLPPELIRTRRINNIYFVDLPNANERRESLKIHIGKAGIPIPDDLELAVEASDQCTHSDIEEFVGKAVWMCDYYNGHSNITGQNIVDEMEGFVPQSLKFPEDYARMTEWANEFAQPASSPLQLEDEVEEPIVSSRRRTRPAIAR